jgi:hypothetical protein
MKKYGNSYSPTPDGRAGASSGAEPTPEADIGRKSLWVIRELGLPTIVKPCVSCRSTRHHPSGKFRVNANGKLLDVWLLVYCDVCGGTSKIPVHERIHVRALENSRLMMYQNNDPVAVRELAMSASLAGRAKYRLDWSGTWRLETDVPFSALEDLVPITVLVRFELPAPIRLEKILMLGFGIRRPQLRSMIAAEQLQLPAAVDAKLRDDFTMTVTGLPSDAAAED